MKKIVSCIIVLLFVFNSICSYADLILHETQQSSSLSYDSEEVFLNNYDISLQTPLGWKYFIKGMPIENLMAWGLKEEEAKSIINSNMQYASINNDVFEEIIFSVSKDPMDNHEMNKWEPSNFDSYTTLLKLFNSSIIDTKIFHTGDKENTYVKAYFASADGNVYIIQFFTFVKNYSIVIQLMNLKEPINKEQEAFFDEFVNGVVYY